MTLKKLYFFIFLIGWFFFPFNHFDGIPALGEFKSEAGSFFFMAGFALVVLDSIFKLKIAIPYKSRIFQVLLLFFVWCILTILFNFSAVNNSYFKHIGGFNRFFRQYLALFLSAFVFVIFYWNVIRYLTAVQILFIIRKVLLACLVFAFVYGFIETLIIFFGFGFLRPILNLFDYFPFLDVTYQSSDRIASIAYEAPSLGNYLITISGWMFSYIFTEKNKWRFVPTMMILFLTFFSGSRTALINITLQLIILGIVMYRMEKYRKILINVFQYTFMLASFLLILNGSKIIKEVEKKMETLNFSKNLTKNLSNQSRFGMQYASLQVFREHPIIGVGFGQETYYKRFHYPGWATKNNYEFDAFYKNTSVKSFPSAYNIYTRLLAETGIIGLFIFGTLIYLCISKSIFLWKNSKDEEKILALVLIISFSGLSLNWMQTDFFRQHGFWLCMVILIKLLSDRNAKISDGRDVLKTN